MFTLSVNLSPKDIVDPNIAMAIIKLSHHTKIDKRWVEHMKAVIETTPPPPFGSTCHYGQSRFQPPPPYFGSSSCDFDECSTPSRPTPPPTSGGQLDAIVESIRSFKKAGMLEPMLQMLNNLLKAKFNFNFEIQPEMVDLALSIYDGQNLQQSLGGLLMKYMSTAMKQSTDASESKPASRTRICPEDFTMRMDKILETSGIKREAEVASEAASSTPVDSTEESAPEPVSTDVDTDAPKTSAPITVDPISEAMSALFSGFGVKIDPSLLSGKRRNPEHDC